MAILKIINNRNGKRKRANLPRIIKYVLQDKKTEQILVYGKNLEPERAYEMMKETKETFGKKEGREYYHFVMSFPPTENITPAQALEQAKIFLESSKKFIGYEVLAAAHKDRKHVHVHFIVNSVNFVNGKKFHLTRSELDSLKTLQNEINIKAGYSPAPEKYVGITGEKRTETVCNDKNTYQLLKKAEIGQVQSYVQTCAVSVLINSKKAKSKMEFIDLMMKDGFRTVWYENKKHITFIDIKREKAGEAKCKIRLSKLADYYSEFEKLNTKEELEYEFNKHNTVSGKEQSNSGKVAANTTGSGQEKRTNSGIEKTDIGFDLRQQKERFNNQRSEYVDSRTRENNLRTTGDNQSAAIDKLSNSEEQRETNRVKSEENNRTKRRKSADYEIGR